MNTFGFSSVEIARRLRWVMLAMIVIDITLTALGQPSGYWVHPAAVDEANRLFHFVMVRGPIAWFAFELVYLTVAFLVASLGCGRCALFGIFSYMLGHYYGACTWLTNHWHLGTASAVAYAMVVASAIVLLAFPADLRPAEARKRAP